MSWAKVDDKFFAHPKVTRVSFGARGLWVTALSWCASIETDGFIPLEMLSVFAATESQQSYAALVDELVRTVLWVDAVREGVRGYQVHDYGIYNPLHKRLNAQRKKEATRLRAYRKRTAVRVGDRTPLPTRPDPSRPVQEAEQKKLAVARKERATPWPPDFTLTDERNQLGKEIGAEMPWEWNKFKDHHTAKGSRFVDWNAAWRTWLRNSVDFQQRRTQR